MPDTIRPAVAPAGVQGGTEPVRLSVIAASGVQFDWHEGTAVVQGVCALIGGTEAEASMALPDQEHILVHSDGSLSFSSDRPTARSAGAQVKGLARLLLSVVSESEMPVKLRLMLLSAISDATPFAAVADFSRALVYFERPGRAADIRAVYLRWRTRPAEPSPAGPPRPGSAPAKHDKPPVPSRPRRQHLAVVLAAVSVLVAGGAAAWWVSGRPAAAPIVTMARTATELVSRAWTAVSGLAASGAAAVRSAAGGAPEPAPGAAPADTGAGEKAQAARPPVARRDPTPAGSTGLTPQPSQDVTVPPPPQLNVPPIKAFDLAASPADQPSTGETPLPSPPLSLPESGRTAGTAPRRDDITGPIYTVADHDVEPPVPVKPKIATVLPTGEREQNLTVVDLIISDDGQVESIKLVRPAEGVRETMILSAVKAWRFKPAMKDAKPVYYLKRIWISLSPIGTVGR